MQTTARTGILEKDPATTLEQGQLCSIDAGGLAIKTTALSTEVALVMAVLSDTRVQVMADDTVVLKGTADANFAKANRNTEVDVAIDGSGNQLIDLGASSTDVLKVLASEEAGTVGSTLNVLVRINKPIAL